MGTMRRFLICFYALCVIACTSQEVMPPRGVIEMRFASYDAQEGWYKKQINNSQQAVYLSDVVSINTQDIALVEAAFDPQGEPAVIFKMTAVGRRKFAKMTEAHKGKPIGLVVNGVLLSAPVVQEKIAGGTFILTGLSSVQEASDVAGRANGHSSRK